MEFLEAFKSRYEQYYKRTEIATTNRDTIDAALNANRRQTRANLLSQRRNIEESILSPIAITTSTKQTTKATKKKNEKASAKPMDRLAMLKLWKQEKENKKKEDKKKQKPIFKLGAPQNVGFPIEPPSFAPPNHKFKVPDNIKPIKMKPRNPLFQRVTRSQKPISSPPLPLPSKRKKIAVPKTINVHNTQTTKNKSKNNLVRQNAFDAASNSQEENVDPFQAIEENTVQKKRRSSKRKSTITSNTNNNSTKRRTSRRKSCKNPSTSEHSSDLNSTYEMVECSVAIDKLDARNITKTPDNKHNTSIYISPFVTTSRGKGSMKKENHERSIRGLPSFTEFQTPDKEKNSAFQVSGAAYFHTVLNNQIGKLEELCKIWQEYKNANTLTEDVEDSINVAIGQANLLMNKKFQQFKGLIHSCETGEGQEKPVTCEDLQGFWDMIYMQVENLNIRFNRLTSLKESNWEEIVPVVVAKIQKKRTNTKKPSVTSSTSTGLRAAIEAARKKKQSKITPEIIAPQEEKSEEAVFNGGFFVVRSPIKTPTRASKTPRKTSLRVSVLSTEAKKRTKSIGSSSASLSMTRASQIAKSVENLSMNFTLPTPGKSILKKVPTLTATPRGSRVVLFKDGDSN